EMVRVRGEAMAPPQGLRQSTRRGEVAAGRSRPPIAKRLLLPVQLQPLRGGRAEIVLECRVIEGARLVAGGLLELSPLGVARGQGVRTGGTFPDGPLASHGGVFDRPLAVTGLVVRARRQEPGQRIAGRSPPGQCLDGPEVGLFRLGVPALLLEDLAE